MKYILLKQSTGYYKTNHKCLNWCLKDKAVRYFLNATVTVLYEVETTRIQGKWLIIFLNLRLKLNRFLN